MIHSYCRFTADSLQSLTEFYTLVMLKLSTLTLGMLRYSIIKYFTFNLIYTIQLTQVLNLNKNICHIIKQYTNTQDS